MSIHINSGLHMYGINWHCIAVNKAMAAADRCCPLVWIDLHMQLSCRPLRLRNGLVFPKLPLIFGAALHPFAIGNVLIEYIRVVEDKTAHGKDEPRRDYRDTCRR